jgi:hypothetical protein
MRLSHYTWRDAPGQRRGLALRFDHGWCDEEAAALGSRSSVKNGGSSPLAGPPPDGRVLVELKTVWRDGTSHFLFGPIEFLEKLAAPNLKRIARGRG